VKRAVSILIVVLAWSRADAYPQFQLSRDQTCTSCHLSPSGGGLLNENGVTTSESMSQFGTSGEFLNGVPMPTWLALGGDMRSAAGIDARPDTALVWFPMQFDLYAQASYQAFAAHVTVGLQDPRWQSAAPGSLFGNNYDYSSMFISREHWLQWQSNPGGNDGLYVRAGRFMPVFGLRFVEHRAYDRWWGGTPLYSEAYGVAAEYVSPKWELHATAFVHDPLQSTTELGNGAAVYAETRLDKSTAIGVEGKLDFTSDDRKLYGGVTAKHYLGMPQLLIQGELQIVHQKVDKGGTNNQLVGYAMGSYFFGPYMIDLGVGLWQPELGLRYLDQQVADLDVHWFATSHIELALMNRLQMVEFGAGGLTSGYVLAMLHYRL
jgi:hypothetical protein